MAFRYQERMHISYKQLLETPWEQIELASYIWSLDAEAVRVNAERHNQN